MAIRKIDKSEIDFTKVYGSSSSAASQDSNTIKVNEKYWGDNSDLYFDDETGLVSENGVGLGFINKNDLLSVQKIDEAPTMENELKNTLEQENIIPPSDETVTTISFDNIGETKEDRLDDIQNENPAPAPQVTSEASVEKIEPQPVAEKIEQPPIDENTITMNGPYRPEDFSYSLEDSNILAAKAKNMGFSDEQVKIALAISRFETGNYEHLAYGYNYGGVTGEGDLGKEGGYAKYSSKDKGMDGYLENLKTKYFDEGLNSVESIARKYLGYDDTSAWIRNVNAFLK